MISISGIIENIPVAIEIFRVLSSSQSLYIPIRVKSKNQMKNFPMNIMMNSF